MSSARTRRRVRAALFTVAILSALPAVASAQGTPRRPTTPRRGAAIEIRGQVPTPQVVTVRPREVPAFSRQVLVPSFYDRHFWPAILPGYQFVARRSLSGGVRADSTYGAPGASPTTPSAPTTVPPVPAPAPADSGRRPPGTAPAR